MKIKVAQLEPNPFRRMAEYPVDREKVEALKLSINETSFWDNLLARKAGNRFQIAYGHHRLLALQELGKTEVDIPVRDLDDGMMIKIMANENRDSYKTDREVVIETVKIARSWLREQMDKGWNTFDASVRGLIKNEHAFKTARGMGVGRDLLKAFLGGNWSDFEIQHALEQMDVDKNLIDEEAIKPFKALSKAGAVMKAFKEYKVPKAKQKAVVETLLKERVPRDDVDERVSEMAVANAWAKEKRKAEKELKPLPDINEYAKDAIFAIAQAKKFLIRLTGNYSYIRDKIRLMNMGIALRGLKAEVDNALVALEKLDIKPIKQKELS